MTANEWTQIVHVMRLKWPNFNWEDDTIKSVYNELKSIDARYVEKSIEQKFKAGTQFPPNPSEIYASAMEIMRYDKSSDNEIPQIEEHSCTLQEYIQSQGWESVAEGMYHFGRERYLKGTQEKHEDFEYDLEWNKGGKEKYIERFGMANSSLLRVMENISEEENNGVS